MPKREPKTVLETLTGYPSIFLDIVFHPRFYAIFGRAFDSSRLNEALTYMSTCLVLALILRIPLYNWTIVHVNQVTFLLNTLFLLFNGTLAVMVTWKVLRGRGTMKQYFVATCFYFGTFLVLTQTVLLIDHAWKNILLGAASNWARLIVINLGVSWALTGWLLFSWMGFSDYNRAACKSFMASLVLITTLLVIIVFSSIFLEGMALKAFIWIRFHILACFGTDHISALNVIENLTVSRVNSMRIQIGCLM